MVVGDVPSTWNDNLGDVGITIDGGVGDITIDGGVGEMVDGVNAAIGDIGGVTILLQ